MILLFAPTRDRLASSKVARGLEREHAKMLRVMILAALVATSLGSPERAIAGATEDTASASNARSCLLTRIKTITTRLVDVDPKTGRQKNIPNSGYAVVFAGRLTDPYVGKLVPQVVFYQDDAANALIARERVGDTTQVCLVSYPASAPAAAQGAPSGRCDRAKDSRGRLLRVFDVKRKFAYSGLNSEHGCGGA